MIPEQPSRVATDGTTASPSPVPEAPPVPSGPSTPAPSVRSAHTPLGETVAAFRVDLSPLLEQAWLWAEPEAVRFRVIPGEPSARPSSGEGSSLPRPMDDQDGAFLRDLHRALDAWHATPLVWRVQHGVAQAVFRGTYRFTWSCQEPQGRMETWDPLTGWKPLPPYMSPLQHTLIWFVADQDFPMDPLAEQIARHAQRHRPRRTKWSHDTLSWLPVPFSRKHLPEELMRMAQRCLRELRAFGHALARLDPFWRTVVRHLQRLVHPSCSFHMVNDPLPDLLRDWDRWKTVASEHPRAHLMLNEAIRADIVPCEHTWRDEVWHDVMPSARATTWRMLRTGPSSLVNALTRQPHTPGWFVLDLLAVTQTGPLPPAVLRSIPDSLWMAAHQTLGEHTTVRDALQTWPVRRVKAFLDAAQARPWVAQRVTLTVWVEQAQLVLDWAGGLEDGPLADPSWSWNSLVTVWMAQHEHRAPWGAPLLPLSFQGLTVNVVDNDDAWTMLGLVMQNCLKDSRSDHLQDMARQHQGVLLRLRGKDHSALFLAWTANDEPEGSGEWAIGQHHARVNTSATHAHQVAALDLCALFNATLRPEGFLTANDRQKALALMSGERPYVQPFLDALDPAWDRTDGVDGPSGSPLIPAWRHPVARLRHWVHDDAWWTWGGMGAAFQNWLGSFAGNLTVWAILLAGLLTGLVNVAGWTPALIIMGASMAALTVVVVVGSR